MFTRDALLLKPPCVVRWSCSWKQRIPDVVHFVHVCVAADLSLVLNRCSHWHARAAGTRKKHNTKLPLRSSSPTCARQPRRARQPCTPGRHSHVRQHPHWCCSEDSPRRYSWQPSDSPPPKSQSWRYSGENRNKFTRKSRGGAHACNCAPPRRRKQQDRWGWRMIHTPKVTGSPCAVAGVCYRENNPQSARWHSDSCLWSGTFSTAARDLSNLTRKKQSINMFWSLCEGPPRHGGWIALQICDSALHKTGEAFAALLFFQWKGGKHVTDSHSYTKESKSSRSNLINKTLAHTVPVLSDRRNNNGIFTAHFCIMITCLVQPMNYFKAPCPAEIAVFTSPW